MKYFPLIWAGLRRKPVRSILTLFSVIVAFVLFGALHGVTSAIDGIINSMRDTRLRIQSKVSIAEPLPLAYLARIESVKGVEGVGYYGWFGGYYQDPRNQFEVGAVDVDRLHAMFPELDLKEEYAAAMRTTRNGALIGRDLAAERGWKIGDRIPLKSIIYMRKDGAPQWDFEIVGEYGYTDSKITDMEDRSVVGNEAPLVTRDTINAGLQYRQPLASALNLTFRVDYNRVGETWWEPYNLTSRDPLDLVDARVSLGSDKWTVTAWSKNLTDEEYNTEFSPAPAGSGFLFKALPRRYGLELMYKF